MRATALAITLAGLLLASLFVLTRRDAQPDADSVSGAARGTAAQLEVEAHETLEARESGRRAVGPAPEDGQEQPAQQTVVPGDGPAETERVVLRAVVLERSSQRPLPGFGLVLAQGKTHVELSTDALGCVRTEALWERAPVTVGHAPGPPDTEYAGEWRVDPWRVEPSETPEEQVRLLAEAPELLLDVITRTADGAALEGAEVSLVFGLRDAAGRFHSERVERERSDGEGAARFSIYAEDVRDTSLRIVGRHAERELASEPLALDPPLQRGPWVLHLQAVGSVRLSATDQAGAPLSGGYVVATLAGSARAAMSVAGARIEAGSALLEGLGPGPHRLRVFGSTNDRRELVVDVLPGRETRASVRFDDGTTALAVSGRVVDEQDRPLEGTTVWFEVPGQPDAMLRSGSDGSFAFWSPRTSEVTVSTARHISNDVFDPPTLRVAYGTTDVVLRRARALQEWRFLFEVVDIDTGQPPWDGGGVYGLLGAPRTQGGWTWERLSAGRVALHLKPHAGLRYRVACPGYIPVEGELELDPAPEGPIRVALQRGFARTLHVLDARSGEPVSDARVSDSLGVIGATTDGNGVARLSGRSRPARVRVEAQGYLLGIFQLDDLESVTDSIRLEPLARDGPPGPVR